MNVAGAILHSLIWPAAAATSLAVAVGGREVTALGLILIACGTMAAYGLDRLIDCRVTDAKPIRRMLMVAVLSATLAGAAIAFTAVWRIEVCLLLAVLAGGYVPLKRILPKNWLTVPAWTIAIATLPFAEAPAFDGRHTTAVAAVALIMLANTSLCDLGSVEADRAARVRALSVWIGARRAAIVSCGVAIAGVAVAASHHHWALAITAAALAVLALFLSRHPKSRRGQLAADAIVTLLPGPLSLVIG